MDICEFEQAPCQPRLHGQTLSLKKKVKSSMLGIVVHVYNSNTWEVETGESGIPGHP